MARTDSKLKQKRAQRELNKKAGQAKRATTVAAKKAAMLKAFIEHNPSGSPSRGAQGPSRAAGTPTDTAAHMSDTPRTPDTPCTPQSP